MCGRLYLKIKEVKGIRYLIAEVENMGIENIRQLGDRLRDKIESGIVILYTKENENAVFLAMADKKLVKLGIHAGNLIKEITKLAEGRGGGRQDMAQGGVKDLSKIGKIIEAIPKILEKQIK